MYSIIPRTMPTTTRSKMRTRP